MFDLNLKFILGVNDTGKHCNKSYAKQKISGIEQNNRNLQKKHDHNTTNEKIHNEGRVIQF